MKLLVMFVREVLFYMRWNLYFPKGAIIGLMTSHSMGLVGRGHEVIQIPPAIVIVNIYLKPIKRS